MKYIKALVKQNGQWLINNKEYHIVGLSVDEYEDWDIPLVVTVTFGHWVKRLQPVPNSMFSGEREELVFKGRPEEVTAILQTILKRA